MYNLTGSDTFFISDNHFGHQNIIRYQNRPFTNVQQMDDYMVDCWNQTVKPNSWVFYLGDFGYNTSCLTKLHGKIILVAGNHDKKIRNHNRWHHVTDYLEIKVPIGPKYQDVVLSHYPFIEWNKKHHGSINLHGHCHGHVDFHQINQLDVGVDNIGYVPLCFDQIIAEIQTNNHQLSITATVDKT